MKLRSWNPKHKSKLQAQKLNSIFTAHLMQKDRHAIASHTQSHICNALCAKQMQTAFKRNLRCSLTAVYVQIRMNYERIGSDGVGSFFLHFSLSFAGRGESTCISYAPRCVRALRPLFLAHWSFRFKFDSYFSAARYVCPCAH